MVTDGGKRGRGASRIKKDSTVPASRLRIVPSLASSKPFERGKKDKRDKRKGPTELQW